MNHIIIKKKTPKNVLITTIIKPNLIDIPTFYNNINNEKLKQSIDILRKCDIYIDPNSIENLKKIRMMKFK